MPRKQPSQLSRGYSYRLAAESSRTALADARRAAALKIQETSNPLGKYILCCL
jgi:hypothetical protein